MVKSLRRIVMETILVHHAGEGENEMSLIISIYVDEGVVMASDSRVSFASPFLNSPLQIQTGHHFDSEEKTFVCSNGVGISSCGDASINKKSISGIIKAFINQQIQPTTTVIDTATFLLNYLKQMNPNLNAILHICGYENTNGVSTRQIYRVYTQGKGQILPINSQNAGAVWDGDIHILSKVIKGQYISPPVTPTQQVQIVEKGKASTKNNVFVLDANNTQYLPEISIPWDYMSLQDAINFARFAITTTIEALKFENVNKTVGGPIDILVVKSDGSSWIAHKELH